MISDKTIDKIYDWVDDQLRDGKFDLVDAALRDPVWENIDDDMIVTWLTTTLPAKSKLPNRKLWYEEGLKRMGQETMSGLK